MPIPGLRHPPELLPREIVCRPDETQAIWESLLEWGVGPPDFVEHTEKCKDKAHHVWEAAWLRVREPGGLFWFATEILGFKRLLPEIHDTMMCRKLEACLGTDARFFFEWHRGSYKTVTANLAFVVWALVVQPWHEIMIAQATLPKARKTVKGIKQIIDRNRKLRTLAPHMKPATPPGQSRPEKWGDKGLLIEGKYLGPDDMVSRDWSVVPVGTEMSVAGEHPTILICDDLHDEQNTKSPMEVQRVKDFHVQLVNTVLSRGCPEIVVGTPWAIDDEHYEIRTGARGPYHYSLVPLKTKDENGKWIFSIPKEDVLARLTEWQQVGICGWDEEEDAKLKVSMPYYEYMAQYQCCPVSEEHKKIRPDDWITYDVEGPMAPWYDPEYDSDLAAYAAWVEKLTVYAAVDVAMETGKEADYTAIPVWGIDYRGHGWLLDLFYDKVPPSMLLDALFDLCGARKDGKPSPFWNKRPVKTMEMELRHPDSICWRPRIVFGEDITFGKRLIEDVREEIRKRGIEVPLRKVKGYSQVSKLDRILKSEEPLFRHHRLHFPVNLMKYSYIDKRAVDLMVKARQEVEWMGTRGVKDDFLDATQMLRVVFTEGFRPAPEPGPKDESGILPKKPHPLQKVLKRVDPNDPEFTAPSFVPPVYARPRSRRDPYAFRIPKVKFRPVQPYRE